MKKIGVLIPYFGRFPEWADLYFETLKKNETIDFVFFTDCETEKYSAPNLIFHKISWSEYIESVNRKIEVKFDPANPYKLCDLRPLYGTIHQDVFAPYDFYGWTDMDILFGDIRQFYTEDILENHDVISAHEVRISGHLALFRNTEKNRQMYKKIYRWQDELEKREFVGIDEHGITNAYTNTIFDKFNQKYKTDFKNPITKFVSKLKTNRLYLKEQYTTPFTAIPWLDGSLHSAHPDVWFYKDGVITNERDGDRQFLYLHFMNYKSSQWRHDGTKAPWEGKEKICFAAPEDLEKGIVINNDGIFPL